MDISNTGAARRHFANSMVQLGKSLLLPLLVVGCIVLSLLAFYFVDSGSPELSVWVSDTDGQLQQRIDAIHGPTPLLLRAEGAENSPMPAGCAGRGRELVLQSNEAGAGEALLASLAAQDVAACGGLSYKSNVRPLDASALERQLIGWPHFLVLLCSAAAVRYIYKTYGPPRAEPAGPARPALNVAIGVAGAIMVGACAWLISYALADTEASMPFARAADGLPFLFMIGVSLIVPLLEETAFRAWLIPIAGKVLGTAGVVAFSTLAFAFLHGTLDVPQLAFYAAAGLVFSLVWVRTHSLLACVAAHALYNSWVSLQYFLA